jgi:hypothetical protein
MWDLLVAECGKRWDKWGGGKMNTFWNSNCIAPWSNWYMGRADVVAAVARVGVERLTQVLDRRDADIQMRVVAHFSHASLASLISAALRTIGAVFICSTRPSGRAFVAVH